MFRRNLALLSLVNIYVKLTSLAIIPFVARRFAVADFGVLMMTQSILGYVLDCFDGGIKKVAIRELSQSSGRRFEVKAERFFTIRIVLLAAGFVVMNAFSFLLFQEPHQRFFVFIVSASVLAQAFDITWMYDAHQNMKPAFVSKAIERTLYLLCSLLGIYWVDMEVLAFAFPAAAAVAYLSIWFYKRNHPVGLRSFSRRMNHVHEGLIIGVAGIAASLCLTVDQLMIKRMLGVYELGLYSAASKAAFVVLTFLWIYAYTLFPRLSLVATNSERVNALLTRHTLKLGGAGIATVAVLSFAAGPIIAILFSDKYLSVVPVFKWLNFFLLICFFNVLFSDSLNAFNQQNKRLIIIVKALVINVLLNMIFLPAFGLLGAVYASIIAQLWILIFSYWELRSDFQLRLGRLIIGFLLTGLAIVCLSEMVSL